MAHPNSITVSFGDQRYKFKVGTSPGAVLDFMAKMHPPQGCLKHLNNEDMVALSQEDVLSQEKYTYHQGYADNVESPLLNAILRLQLLINRKLETIGTAVVCSNGGICLTANHCLMEVRRSARNLSVGGHKVKVLAQDEKKDIAALQISEGTDEHQFIQLDGTAPIIKGMKVHLISYPFMADEEFESIGATITHGQVVNTWTPNLIGADYACFSNSSGGAVVHANKLVGIHLENLYEEDSTMKGKKGISARLEHLEINQSKKGCLGNFLNAAAIANFLDEHDLVKLPSFSASSSSSFHRRGRSKLVSDRRQ